MEPSKLPPPAPTLGALFANFQDKIERMKDRIEDLMVDLHAISGEIDPMK